MLTSTEVRSLLEVHGRCAPQQIAEWKGAIPLPRAVSDFYREVGPINLTIDGFGNPTFMPSLSKLWDHQAGYRWNGISGEAIAEWNDDWIVVADEGGDPYIHWNGAIYFALHGEGPWRLGEMYPDLNTMAACLALIGSVYARAGDDFMDNDCNVHPRYLEEALSGLARILGSRTDAQAVVDAAGWD